MSTTIDEQIELLTSRGMKVESDVARQWLSNVSYYRLSAYWYPARENDGSDRFVHGTSFDDVTRLYEADRKLRTLVRDGIERIEVSLRTHIINVLCATDPLAYCDSTNFRPTFNYSSWMETVWRRIGRASKNNDSVRHYEEKYSYRFPLWVVAETLDFSDVSKLFEGLLSRHQQQIAENLGLFIDIDSLSSNQGVKVKKTSPLSRWLEQLVVVRNISAHHGRLWNRSFAPAPTSALRTMKELSNLPPDQSEHIFGTLTLISHILNHICPGSSWQNKVLRLITDDFLSNPLVLPTSLGIPHGWNQNLT